MFSHLPHIHNHEGNLFDSIETKCLLIFMWSCLTAKQNQTNRVDLVWVSLVIELTKKL